MGEEVKKVKTTKMKCALIVLYLVTLPGCENHHNKDHRLYGDDGELCASDATWSHGEGDLQNTKRASGIRTKDCFYGPVDTPKVQWSFPIGGPGNAGAPVIGDDGTIYLVGEYPGEVDDEKIPRNSGLMAISPSGSLKWFFKIPLFGYGFYFKSPAISRDGTIYLSWWDSTFYAINSDGNLKWKYYLGPGAVGSSDPVIDDDGNIYAGKDTIFCFNSSGNVRWRSSIDLPLVWKTCHRVVLGKNYIFCGYRGFGILALDYKGRKQWFYPVDLEDFVHYGILVDEDENLYFKTGPNGIESIDKNGQLRWKKGFGILGGGMTEPVLRGDYLYFGVFQNVVKLHKDTGEIIWSVETFRSGEYVSQHASPLIDDQGILYITAGISLYYGGPSLVAVSAATGEKLWGITIPAVSSASEGYLGLSSDGHLYLAGQEFDNAVQMLYSIK